MQLAARLSVTAIDASESRLARLRENLERPPRSGDPDRRRHAWSPPAQVDAILLEAPCSAPASSAGHPDVLHRVRRAPLPSSRRDSWRCWPAPAGWLKAGGTLIYSVCSLEPEEGEQVLTDLLKEAARLALDQSAGRAPAGLRPNNDVVRILPGWLAEQGGADGFFIARSREIAAIEPPLPCGATQGRY
jgi:16S rRNA (cytosine967-C5)-methyltransferase